MPSDRIERSRTGVENAIINESGTEGNTIPNQIDLTPAETPAPAAPAEETPAE
jgi:hypothetical protein